MRILSILKIILHRNRYESQSQIENDNKLTRNYFRSSFTFHTRHLKQITHTFLLVSNICFSRFLYTNIEILCMTHLVVYCPVHRILYRYMPRKSMKSCNSMIVLLNLFVKLLLSKFFQREYTLRLNKIRVN